MADVNQCLGLTKNGMRCKKMVKDDARCYLHRNDVPQKITKTHTKVLTPPKKPLEEKEKKTSPPRALGEGKMMLHNRWSRSITRQGLKIGAVKSALQKNIRRGNTIQALACAYEMFSFIDIGGYEVVHNLMNRLAVIACEDLTPGEIGMASYVCGWDYWYVRKGDLKWVNDTNLVNYVNPKEKRYNFSYVAALVGALCVLEKSRLPSHLWNKYVRLETPLDYPKHLKDVFKDGIAVEKDLKVESGEDIINLSNVIYTLLSMGMEEVFGYLGEFYAKYVDEKVMKWKTGVKKTFKITKNRGRTRCDVLLWNIVRKFIPSSYVDPIENAYWNASEKRPYIQYVFTHILYFPVDGYYEGEDEGTHIFPSVDTISKKVDEAVADEWDVDEIEEIKNIDVVIEDYMMDLHTGKTGNRNDLVTEFRKEGSKVTNQDPVYYNQELEELYMGVDEDDEDEE